MKPVKAIILAGGELEECFKKTGETAIKADIETREWRNIKIIMGMKKRKILLVFITLITLLGIIAMSQVECKLLIDRFSGSISFYLE